jgi:hypothetical protein
VLATTLNAIGLVCNIVGAGLLFRYGVPAHRPVEDAGKGFLLLEEEDHDQARGMFRAVEISRWAMLLLVVGFIIQFVALFR